MFGFLRFLFPSAFDTQLSIKFRLYQALSITAAAIQAQGSIALGAGNNLNLGVVTIASQNTQNQGPNNQKTENQKTEGQVLQYATLLASSEPNRYSFEIS